MKDLEKNYVHYGRLKTDTDSLENIRCEIQMNILETSKMKADIYDLEGTSAFKFMKDFMGKQVSFESVNEKEETILDGYVSSGQLTGMSDKIGTLRINKYVENIYLNRDSLEDITFIYYLTPIEMFKRTRMKCFDDMKGLLYGYDNWSNKDKPSWKNEAHSYSLDVGELTFYPGLVFVENENEKVTTIDQTKVVISIKNESINLEEVRKKIEDILQTYLHIMSFLENRFIYWFHCEIDARSANGKGMLSTICKNIPLREYRKSDHIARYSKEYREIVPKLVSSYLNLDASTKNELDKAIHQMLIATKPDQPFDTELIYWHSCLDILIKILSASKISERKNLGFSKKLILACEDANIEWNDLYSYVKREDIFSIVINQRSDIKITTIRNDMIHDGQYPDSNEYDSVFTENNKAAALVERMVLSILGFDYRGTVIGKYRQFR